MTLLNKHSKLCPRDYRTVKKPALRMQDVLVWIIQQHRGITSSEVMHHFNIQQSDASMRLQRLWKYGLAKRNKENMKKGWGYVYRVSQWGRKYARDQKLI